MSLAIPGEASPDSSAGSDVPTCDNCGAALVGPFCHLCGQHDVDHLASLREFFVHLAEVVAGYDSRLLRTMRGLFTQPGFLTAEYIGGRRARYLPPVQIYVVAATLLFVAASFKPMVSFTPATRVFSSALSTISMRDSLSLRDVQRLKAKGVSLELFAERFQNATTSRLSSFLVLLVPLFSLLVASTWLFAPRPFAHHVLFSLHWSAAYLAMLAVLQLLPIRSYMSVVTSFVLLAVPFGYLVVALRRSYRTGWVASVLRGAALYFGFLALLGSWLQLITEYTVRHM